MNLYLNGLAHAFALTLVFGLGVGVSDVATAQTHAPGQVITGAAHASDTPEPAYVLARRPLARACQQGRCRSVRVQAANQQALRCADGRARASCLVQALDLSDTGWPTETAQAFQQAFFRGTALAQGKFVRKGRRGRSVLRVQAGWLGQSGHPPLGVFYAVRRPDDACDANACSLTLNAAALNAPAEPLLHPSLDLSTTGLPAEQLARGRQALAHAPGLVVVGLAVPFKQSSDTGEPDATPRKLLASEFYLPVVHP